MAVNRLVVGSIPTRDDEIFIYIYIFTSSFWCRGENAALSYATQHAMPSEIGGKWGTECLNTRFPLPTLLCEEYSVKLEKKRKLCFFYLRYFRRLRGGSQPFFLLSL